MRAALAGCLLAAWLLAACTAPVNDPARVWTSRQFPGLQGKDVAGLKGELLGAPEGGVIPFRGPPYTASPSTQGSGFGLTIFPAFEGGGVAAFTLTEVWEHHPLPWVQPVWALVASWHPENPAAWRVPLDAGVKVPTIFGAGDEASFYSPFWQAHFVDVDAETVAPDAFTSAKAVLDSQLPIHDGPLVFCPILDDGFNLAQAAGEDVVRPFTGGQLLDHGAPVHKALVTAWVDGTLVHYVDFGPGRFTTWETGAVQTTDLFAFASRAHPDQLLPVPLVLSDDASTHSLMSLYAVSLPAGAEFFVPAGRPELAALLLAEGFPSTPADTNIPPELANQYFLRAATDARCFADAGAFPAGCSWVDSQAAVALLAQAGRLTDRETLWAVAVFAVDGGAP